jgi:hypothetical protein
LSKYGKIKSDIRIENSIGNLRMDLRSYVFDNGPGLLLGIIPDMSIKSPPGSKACIKLEREYCVYNVRRQKYMGRVSSFEIGINKNRAKLYAMLPERIEGINASLNKFEFEPGENVLLKGAIEPSELEACSLVARITVSRSGEELKCFSKNLAYKGAFSYVIPLALNQKSGTYKVSVEDIISGYTRELKFTVK